MTTKRELWEAEVEARLDEVEARSMMALRALRDAGLLATCPICEGKRVVPGEDGGRKGTYGGRPRAIW